MTLRTRGLLAVVSVMLVVMSGMAVAAAGPGEDAADDVAQIVADAKRTELAIVAAWNGRKWDELGALYSKDALVLPPNHDPVQGRDAIIEYFRSVRDLVGEIADGWEHVRVKGSGNFASIAGTVEVQAGRIRMTFNDLYERQPDGSVLLAVNALGFRELPAG